MKEIIVYTYLSVEDGVVEKDEVRVFEDISSAEEAMNAQIAQIKGDYEEMGITDYDEDYVPPTADEEQRGVISSYEIYEDGWGESYHDTITIRRCVVE